MVETVIKDNKTKLHWQMPLKSEQGGSLLLTLSRSSIDFPVLYFFWFCFCLNKWMLCAAKPKNQKGLKPGEEMVWGCILWHCYDPIKRTDRPISYFSRMMLHSLHPVSWELKLFGSLALLFFALLLTSNIITSLNYFHGIVTVAKIGLLASL